MLPKDCSVERLALYQDSLGKVLIDGEIWKQLDVLNRAALIFHEASYFYERKMRNATDSQRTRTIVRNMFADQPIPGLYEGLDEKKIVCQGRFQQDASDNDLSGELWTEYYFSEDTQGNYFFNFYTFLGTQMYSQTAIKFGSETIKDQWGDHYKNYGNAEVIHSDIDLPPMRLISVSSNSKNKKIILEISGEGTAGKYKNTTLKLTDDNGDMDCSHAYPDHEKIHLDRLSN